MLANWVPGELPAGDGRGVVTVLASAAARWSSATPRWGDEPAARALVTDAGLEVGAASRESLTLDFEGRAQAIAFLVATAGHVVAERPRLEAEGRWPSLLGALGGLVAERDEGHEGASRCGATA